MHPLRTIHHLRRCLGAAAAAALLFLGAGAASAQVDVLDLPIPGLGPPPLTGDIEQVGKRAFWRAGKQRWFFASTLELGNLYLRGGASVGYGKPHWSWVGLEGSSAISPNGGVTYGGVRFSTPWVDLRAGARYLFTANHSFLVPRETYTREDLEHRTLSDLRYVTMEAEAASGYPVPRGVIFGILGAYRVIGTPQAFYLFEQTLQTVAKPKLLWRARVGYLARIDKWDMFRVGLAVEAIGNPPRGTVMVRTGPAVTVLITHHLEAFGAALLPVYNTDPIGTAAAQFGELGFRYRWATGDRWPELP
jgi:hypothetical protein